MPKITTNEIIDMGPREGHVHVLSFQGCQYETDADSAIGGEDEHFHVVGLWRGNVSSSWAKDVPEHKHDFDRQEFIEFDTEEVYDPEPEDGSEPSDG